MPPHVDGYGITRPAPPHRTRECAWYESCDRQPRDGTRCRPDHDAGSIAKPATERCPRQFLREPSAGAQDGSLRIGLGIRGRSVQFNFRCQCGGTTVEQGSGARSFVSCSCPLTPGSSLDGRPCEGNPRAAGENRVCLFTLRPRDNLSGLRRASAPRVTKRRARLRPAPRRRQM